MACTSGLGATSDLRVGFRGKKFNVPGPEDFGSQVPGSGVSGFLVTGGFLVVLAEIVGGARVGEELSLSCRVPLALFAYSGSLSLSSLLSLSLSLHRAFFRARPLSLCISLARARCLSLPLSLSFSLFLSPSTKNKSVSLHTKNTRTTHCSKGYGVDLARTSGFNVTNFQCKSKKRIQFRFKSVACGLVRGRLIALNQDGYTLKA